MSCCTLQPSLTSMVVQRDLPIFIREVRIRAPNIRTIIIYYQSVHTSGSRYKVIYKQLFPQKHTRRVLAQQEAHDVDVARR